MKIKKTKLFAPQEYGQQPCCYHDAATELIADVTGGCGPGGFGDLLVPDTLWGLSVKPSCVIHDWMYHFGETAEDKDLSDRIFLNNMVRQIRKGTRWRLLRWLRYLRAHTYYVFVSRFGGPSFWDSKNTDEEFKPSIDSGQGDLK